MLHIEGLVPRIILDDTGDTPQYAIEGQDYFSILELADGSTSETTLLRITSGGDVGINTTSAGYGGNSNNQYLSISFISRSFITSRILLNVFDLASILFFISFFIVLVVYKLVKVLVLFKS